MRSSSVVLGTQVEPQMWPPMWSGEACQMVLQDEGRLGLGRLPESRTSTIARLLGALVDRSSADRASRLIRGRVAMLIEDIVVAIILAEDLIPQQ